MPSDDKKNLSLIKIDIPVTTNWPWGGEPILCSSTQKKIGNISSVGYDTIDSNTIYMLSVIDQSQRQKNADVIIKVGLDEYRGSITNQLFVD